MSFATPLALLCLAVVPLAVLVHVMAGRRRRRYPVRFTAISTLAAVAAGEPQWRRQLPFALLALALAALSLSLARPQRTVQVAVERAAVVLVTDVSGSMAATDVKPTRLQAARQAAERFLGRAPAELRVGLVAFSDIALTLQRPTADREQLRAGLQSLQPLTGTFTGAGLRAALDSLELSGAPAAGRPPAAIVLLSDGAANDGNAADLTAIEARRLRVPIYTVALGTPGGTITQGNRLRPVPPDPAALARIATASGGQAFRAEDADELDAVYNQLGSQLGTEPEEREITALFAGGALLLLAGAVAGSLRFGGRLP